jgi:acyl-CoA thioesterase II
MGLWGLVWQPWRLILTKSGRNHRISIVFDLEPHGPDTYVGIGPRYPWGGLYGGQIVAQALRAAAATIDSELTAHSLRAYFIRRGDHSEPIRYEVDRIRNGRSFATRRVVARQAVGAILNLEASFQLTELSASVQSVEMPVVPPPDALENSSWTRRFDRCFVPDADIDFAGRTGSGRTVGWLKVNDDLGDPDEPAAALIHRCWLAYLSDDLATDAAVRSHPRWSEPEFTEGRYTASLDHTMWFHRPLRADRWHVHDVTCHAYVGSRGLAIGHVFAADGTHVATFAQECLLRDPADRA